MKTIHIDQAIELWDRWWNEMKEEWFKIEVLQDYSGEDMGPSLQAWLDGDKNKSIELMVGEMEEWIATCKTSPAQKIRFRILKMSFTPYTEWEMELYRQVNVPLCGEQVYIIPYEKIQHLSIPDGDVAIFDQKRVVRAHYVNGKVETMDFYEENILKFISLRKKIQAYAVKLDSV